MGGRGRWLLWALVGLCWVVFGLGLHLAQRDALWFDEMTVYYYIGGAQYQPLLPFSDFLVRIINADRLPPLYYMLVAAWGQWVGWGAFTSRFLSVGFGVILLALVGRLGADWQSARLGGLAALLLATSAFFMYFTHEVRAYTFYPMLLLWVLLLYGRALQAHTVKPLMALGFVLGVVLALYTHPTSYFFMAALGVYHLLAERRSKTYLVLILLLGISAVLALPWVLIMIRKAIRQQVDIGETGWDVVAWGILDGFGNGLGVLLVLGVGVALWRARGRHARLLFGVLGGTLLVTLVLDAVSPFLFHMRHIIVLLPLLMLALAWGALIAAQRFPRGVAVAVALWVGMGMWNTFDMRYMLRQPGHEPTIPMSAMQPLIAARACIPPEDAVVLYLGAVYLENGFDWEWILDPTMTYYWEGVPFRYAHVGTLLPIINTDPILLPRPRQPAPLNVYAERTRAFVAEAPRVWHVWLPYLPLEIEQRALLMATLDETGYAPPVPVVDTPTLAGWVRTLDDAPIPECF